MKKETAFKRLLRFFWIIVLTVAFGPFLLGYEYHPFSYEGHWSDIIAQFESWAEGNITNNTSIRTVDHDRKMVRYRWDVTSSENGTVWTALGQQNNVSGTIWQIKIIPDDAGDDLLTGNCTPDDNFNVEIRGDYLSENLINNAGATCPNDSITREWPTTGNSFPIYVWGENLNVYCSGMGNTTKARIELEVRDDSIK